MEVKVTWDEFNVKENIEETLVKILMLKGEKGDTGTTDYNELINKPTKLSDFTNDGVYITNAVNDLKNYYTASETYTQAEVNNLVSEIPKFAIAVVQQLPTEDISPTTIYLVPSHSEDTDIYKEYIYVNNTWELLGIQKLDLVDYYNKTDVDGLLDDKADSATVTTLSDEVATNTGNIATNTSNIATNTSNIADLESAVSTKAESSTVSSLTDQVNTNTDDISDLDTRITNQKHSADDITSGELSIERGGTGAGTAETARANLGLEIEAFSWTPTLKYYNGTTVSYTVEYNIGTGYRIGRLVYIACATKLNNVAASPSGQYLTLAGLPYVGTVGTGDHSAAVGELAGALSAPGARSAYLRHATNTINLQNADGSTALQSTGGTIWIKLSVTYLAD